MLKHTDIVVVLLGLLFVGSLYKTFWFGSDEATFAQISVAKQAPQLLSLNSNRKIAIQGAAGVSELEIKDGQIRFLRSPCANQICVHTGWLSQGGAFAACLPNRVAVELLADHNALDAINF